MAGGDLNYLRAAGPPDAPAQAEGVITPFHEAMRILVALPFPVVAQVHGAVAGAGLSIMLACDFAVAADDTRFAFAYSRIATNPDGGLSWLLPRAIGVRRAMRLAFVEDVIGAAEAVGLGPSRRAFRRPRSRTRPVSLRQLWRRSPRAHSTRRSA